MRVKIGDLVTTKQSNPKNPLRYDNLGIVIGTSDKPIYNVASIYWFRFNENKVGQPNCQQPMSYLIVVSSS